MSISRRVVTEFYAMHALDKFNFRDKLSGKQFCDVYRARSVKTLVSYDPLFPFDSKYS